MNKQNIATIENNTSTGVKLLTIPTRIHGFLNEKMKQSVQELNKNRKPDEHELTVADFIRIAAAEKVAQVLHEEVQELPPVVRGRGGDMVAQMAKKLGISQDEFKKRAAELVASQGFGYKGPGNELMERVLSGDLQVVGGGGNSTGQQRKPNESGQHQIAVTRNISNGRTQRRVG